MLGLVGDFFFGKLFIVELDDFLDRAGAFAEIVANGNELLNDDGRASDGFHHDELAALDALGDGNFAFAGEQRNGAHFAEVHANGIIGFFERAGGQVEIGAARFFGVRVVFKAAGFAIAVFDGKFDSKSGFGGSLVFVNFDAIAFKGGEKVVDLFRRVHFGRKRIVDLVIEQVAALFADSNERFYRFVFFFKNLRHKSSRS